MLKQDGKRKIYPKDLSPAQSNEAKSFHNNRVDVMRGEYSQNDPARWSGLMSSPEYQKTDESNDALNKALDSFARRRNEVIDNPELYKNFNNLNRYVNPNQNTTQNETGETFSDIEEAPETKDALLTALEYIKSMIAGKQKNMQLARAIE